jgi:uroporphyrinogen-III decarboxylase
MLDFYDDPDFVRDLMDFVVEIELGFAKAQIEAGVEIMGIGDPASSLVGPRFYKDLVFANQKKMIDGIHAMGARVRLHICGDTRHIHEGLGRVGPISSTKTRWLLSTRRAARWDLKRCCWATSIPCAF